MSAAPQPTAPTPPPGADRRKPTLQQEFFQFFGSLKLAIMLLLLIAIASTIGTVLPQDQGPAVINDSTFHPVAKQVLLAIKAHDVYHAFWFNFLLAMLFLNLAVCTYLRFPPTWRRYQLAVPPAPPLQAMQESQALPGAPEAIHLDMLRKRGYRLSALPNGEYFAEKNKFVRLGPTFIHISLFAIILGGIIGGLTGIKNSLPLLVGETIHSKEIHDTSYIKGSAAPAPAPFTVRLDSFRMDFRPNGQVKQYYSDLTVTPANGAPYQKKIWVNEPLIHEGMYFYQSFWGIGALTYQVGDGPKTKVMLTQAKSGGYISKPFTAGGEAYVFFVRAIESPALVVAVKDVKPVAQVVPGARTALPNSSVTLNEYHMYSGLETKRDPGIPLVYFGCGILIFGLSMVGVSHREVWVRRWEHGWVIGGRTHKGRLMLRKELEAIARVWPHSATPTESNPYDDLGAKAS